MSVAGIDPLEGFEIWGHDRPARAPVVTDVMRRDPATVRDEMPIRQAARRLVVGGAPGAIVVDRNGQVVGVLTERDLLVRFGPRPRNAWWTSLVDPDRLAREYRRVAGVTAGDVMTPGARTVRPNMPLSEAAGLFDRPDVTVVAVLEDDRLVGSLSRRDIVVGLMDEPGSVEAASDAALVERMEREMAREHAWLPRRRPAICAHDGVLELWGLVDSEAQRAALETMARAIPGCRGVDSHLALRCATLRGMR
jgi:CBS domain-containing protein